MYAGASLQPGRTAEARCTCGAEVSRPLTGGWGGNSVRSIAAAPTMFWNSAEWLGCREKAGVAWHSGNITSPVLSKEGKSDGSRYKKIEKYERHEESGLSRFLFPVDETDSVHLSHLPFFGCPWKRPNWNPSLSLSLYFPLSRSLSHPLSLFLSLVSSDTLVRLGVEEQRDSAMGLLEEMERRREEKRGG